MIKKTSNSSNSLRVEKCAKCFVSTLFTPSVYVDADLFRNNERSVEEREGSYAKLVNAYYELATLFYEWGWGSSFHFASRWRGETFQESIKVRETKPWKKADGRWGGKTEGLNCGPFEAMVSDSPQIPAKVLQGPV